jgi:hypothetical protein
MGIPHRILNTRASQPVHDALALRAERKATKPGTLHREFLEQSLLVDRIIELYATVGFLECWQRLTTPSYDTQISTRGESGGGQTKANKVLRSKTVPRAVAR